jgi:hypothetical protein
MLNEDIPRFIHIQCVSVVVNAVCRQFYSHFLKLPNCQVNVLCSKLDATLLRTNTSQSIVIMHVWLYWYRASQKKLCIA